MKSAKVSEEEGAALLEDAVVVWGGVPALWCGNNPPQSEAWRANVMAVTDVLADLLFAIKCKPTRAGSVLALLGAAVGCLSREQLVEIGVPRLLKAATVAAFNATGAQAQAERWRLTATLLDAGALAAGDLDNEVVLRALEACDASVAGVAAVLRVAVAVISAAPPDAAARAADRAAAAFLDCAKLGSPELCACVAFRVVTPLVERALNDPSARNLGATAADVCARLLEKTTNPVARRPALARPLAHALCAGARNAACDDAQAAVFGPLAAALCLDRDDEAADAPAAVPDKGTAPHPTSPERTCFDLCAKDHVGPSLARLTTLAFLEGAEAPRALRRAAASALLDLEPALRAESGDAACARSAAWDRRLKLWQALGLLLVRGDLDEPDSALARRVADISALALSSPTALEVRYACEAASAAACRCWPVVVDALLDRVGAVRDGDVVPLAKASEVERAGGREIALGSLMAVAGAALIDGADDSIADAARARRLLGLACGLVGSPRGLVRGVAVLLSKRLFREFPPSETDVTGRALAHALERDPDVARLVKRQGRFFHDLRSADKCSLIHSAEASLVAGLKSDLDLMAVERNRLEAASDLGSYAWKRAAAEVSKKDLATVAATSTKSVAFVQRKVDRVREARLAALQSEDDAATEINGRKRNAVGKETLPLIVCASLVDKAPNLAGLARTCEVFACEQLVVADAAITAKKEFQQIAATAEKWIPIAGVPPAELRGWLEQRRGDGYSVVALEQATGSSDLAARDLSLPTPAVLLLGAEGEGVPNALFDLVDCCVEIPQLGVVRSLNVHVSGAIAVWMFARQVLLKAAGPSGRDAELAALKADLKDLQEKTTEKLRLFREEESPRLEKKIMAKLAKKFPALAGPSGSPKTPNEDEAAA
jgi:tRNA G18 (ribose-2'-O)-methylase SpoU